MRTRNASLLVLTLALVAALGAVLWRATRSAPPPAPAEALQPAVASAPTESVAVDDEPNARELAPIEAETFESLETTVVWPLEVDLQLERAAHAPQAEGVPALGAGATAKLKGAILGSQGRGLRARVQFVAGANEGRVLYCDGLGNFGANDLQPGLSIVQVIASGFPGAQREVLLRANREQLLNLGFGRPAFVEGEVFDAGGKPLFGAKVTIDGQTSTTDEQGVFQFRAIASGEVIVLVEKNGFARYREKLTVPAGSRIEKGRLKYALDAAARLTISLEDPVNARQEALVFLMPTAFDGQRKFPWSSINPIKMWPGGTTTIEDLPRGSVTVRVFHSGARAKPASAPVTLAPGHTETLTLHLEPAPMIAGKVTDDGKPAAGAIVRLEAPDRTNAMLSVFGEANFLYLENEVFPSLPPAFQEVKADARGEFQLTAYEEVAGVRYVTASSSDGRRTAWSVVKPGDTRVELALLPAQGGAGELVMHLEGRLQPLPLRVTINGEPREMAALAPGKDLRIEGLAEGSWKLSVRWDASTLVSEQSLEVRPTASLEVDLPKGAIEGQDEETRRRAGLK